MRLYEAILIGAALEPQTHFSYFNFEEASGGSCALGAMLKGSGLIPVQCDSLPLAVTDILREARQRFPELGLVLTCPCKESACVTYTAELEVLIVHLNDEHRWTREQIARWIKDSLHRRAFEAIFETALQTVEGAFVELLPEPEQAFA
jgi:hypothetical protein